MWFHPTYGIKGEAFLKPSLSMKKNFSGDLRKVERWRAALTKVANLSGWDSKNYESERELIKAIVKYVWDKVRPTITLLHSTDKLVGINFGCVELGRLLDLEAKDVRFIGIWGMGGVGKTTLAQLVFERISHQFEVSKFLVVREDFVSHGTQVNLQKQLLSPILKENIAQVWDERDGTTFIQKCLFNKKVLLVVDGVDNYNQLELLVGNKSWFGEGSRIIVTTRDKRLLIERDIESFEVAELNYHNSIELFSQNAFKKDKPEEGFSKLSHYFVDYCKGLPLALKLLGRSLYKRNLEAWNSALQKLKKIPNPTVIETLKLSYDTLDDMQKDVFLDVAFLCKLWMEEGRVIEMLDSCGFSSRIVIDVLIEKSLLTIHHGLCDHVVRMHGLVQEMAWDIVRQESNGEIGRRRHLFHRDDIVDVFMKNMGTEINFEIKGICLCLPDLEETDSWSCEVFSKMPNLRFLIFHNFKISSGPEFLPNSLRILEWNWYPSKFLPARFQPNLLGELKMQHSKLIQLWDGNLDLPNLKTMDLSYSRNLIKTPDFTGIPNLEMLLLIDCTGLVEIHRSIASNKNLKCLILDGCDSINSFGSKIEMDSLVSLSLRGCSKVKIPEFGEGMKTLSSLNLCETASVELPSSIEHLVGLKNLNLSHCKSLKCLPGTAIFKLKCLRYLNLNGCSKLGENTGETESFIGQKIRKLHEGLLGLIGRKRKSPEPLGLALPFPRTLPSLELLVLSDCNLCEGAIPDDIGYCFPSLSRLDLSGNNFVSLPTSIKCLSKLQSIDLSRCKRLQQLPDLSLHRILRVQVDDCDSLKMLTGPSVQGRSRSTYLAYFELTAVNCLGLVDEEGLNNEIFSLLRVVTQGISPPYDVPSYFRLNIVSCGSKISEWFNIQSEGGSLTVELPPPNRKSEWTGIMFCVVFADQKNNSTIVDKRYAIKCFSQEIYEPYVLDITNPRHVKEDQVWVFFMHRYGRYGIQKTTNCRISFSFNTCCSMWWAPSEMWCTASCCLNGVKRCGARLLYD